MARAITYGKIAYVRKKQNVTWSCTMLLACLCLFVALTLKIALQLQCTELGYQLAHERKRSISYEMERRELDLQLSILKRGDMLDKRARALGLSPLTEQQVRIIR